MAYKATRNEPRVGVGNFTRDFRQGDIIEPGDDVRAGQVPQYLCDYLVSHGLLVDAGVFDGPADTPVPPSPLPPEPAPEPAPVPSESF